MSGFLRGVLWGLLLIGAGWIVGSIYPAPPAWTAPIKQRSEIVMARLDLSPENLRRLRSELSAQDLAQLTRDAARLAASEGAAIIIERNDEASLQEHISAELGAMPQELALAAPAISPDVRSPVASFASVLALCPGMTVSNAPPVDAQRNVRNYAARVNVNGVPIAVNPTQGACLSSNFGARNGRTHKGVDFHSADGGPILAAGDGVIVEQKYRDDYGNMLLIDHGGGVFTRYAHLSSFAPGMEVGARVTAGQQIGLMGNTAAYRIPIHLHYELLLGDYATQAGSFGLTPHSPFEFPTAG